MPALKIDFFHQNNNRLIKEMLKLSSVAIEMPDKPTFNDLQQ